MKCPTCPDVSLVMTERQSVEIDYCPQCRGVWLDRGELDKLIDRAAPPDSARPNANASQPRFEDSDQYGSSERNAGRYPSRKKSWMSEIFD